MNELTEQDNLKETSGLSKSAVEHCVMCNCHGRLPERKFFTETQYSTIKKRSGKESVPFLGLDTGEHKVKFYTETKESLCLVKVWISPYGWAWRILKKLNT